MLLNDTLMKKQKTIKPVWFMRQAGRYLPEYKEVRAKKGGFLELCYDPKAAAEVTIQPIRRFDFDAAIIFSDILVIPQALGVGLKFVEGDGPKLDPVIKANLASLKFNKDMLKPVYDAISLTRGLLNKEKSLIGFCGAPWTLATYMVEGKGGTDFAKTIAWYKEDKASFLELIDIISNAVVAHLAAQIDAGADVLQIFDSWAGALINEPEIYKDVVVRPTTKIVSDLRNCGVSNPIIGFPRASLVDQYELYCEETKVNAISVDDSIDLALLPDNIVLQGNLSNQLLCSDVEAALDKTMEILNAMKDRAFVFNLGHGILQQTNIDNVAKVVNLVKEFRG